MAVLAFCRHGCPFTDLVLAVFSSRLPLQIPRDPYVPGHRNPDPPVVRQGKWNIPDFAGLAAWAEDTLGDRGGGQARGPRVVPRPPPCGGVARCRSRPRRVA